MHCGLGHRAAGVLKVSGVLTGQCECGAVRFKLTGARNEVTMCHCKQCRRTSGHLWASTIAPYKALKLLSDDGLTWYTSSNWAKRGFCSTCGSSLFYRMNGKDHIAIAAGCIDEPNNLVTGKHIFCADKGAYYEITDDVPQLETY